MVHPEKRFVDDVETFCVGKNLDLILCEFGKEYGAHKILELSLLHKRDRLIQKFIGIKRSINILDEVLKKRTSDVQLDFELADRMYAKANFIVPSSVYVWL